MKFLAWLVFIVLLIDLGVRYGETDIFDLDQRAITPRGKPPKNIIKVEKN